MASIRRHRGKWQVQIRRQGTTARTKSFITKKDAEAWARHIEVQADRSTTANALRLAWERSLRRAKIEDFHFHDLRHEAISRFFEMGLTAPEVALISGHRDMRMLFRYAHPQRQRILDQLDKAERLND